jgi:integrase
VTTLKEQYAYYLRFTNLRPSTRVRYGHHWKLIEPFLGDAQLPNISKQDVRLFLATLREQGRGAPTIKGTHQLLRRLLQVAYEEDVIPKNPARWEEGEVTAPPARDAHFLTEEEIDAIASVVPPTNQCLIYALAYAGLRVGEAFSLTIENVDLEKRTIRIVANTPEVGGHLFPGEPKTRNGWRTVDIPPTLARRIGAHLAFFTDGEPGSLVFTTVKGKHIRQSNFRTKILQPVTMELGLGRFRRTTFGTPTPAFAPSGD